jgi:hypothetical protein
MTPTPTNTTTASYAIAELRLAIAAIDPETTTGCAIGAIVKAIELELDYDLWDDAADLATALPLLDASLQPALSAFLARYEAWMEASRAI